MTLKAAVEPLFGTPRSPERPTLGPAICEVMRRLGKPAMPHQQHMANVIGEIDPETGLLAYDEAVIIGPRQGTGKSEFVFAGMTYRCTAFDKTLAEWARETFNVDVPNPGPQSVLYAAQNADEARKKWRRVHLERLKAPGSWYADSVTATLQTNREMMSWANGSTWAPVSQTKKTGGTGDTTDMPVIDEAWAQKSNSLETAIKATMTTREWSQMWILSMIPGLARVPEGSKGWAYLKAKRDEGRKAVAAGQRSGTAFFDYCAAPDRKALSQLDPYDPALWYQCIPGLGYTTSVRKIEGMAKMPLSEFAPEFLGVEWDLAGEIVKWKVIKEHVWEGLFDPISRVSAGAGSRAFCIEISDDRKYAWIGVAGRREDGHWHLEIVEPGVRIPQQTIGVDWVESRAIALNTEWKPSTWVVAKGRQAESLAEPLRKAGLKVLVASGADMAGACGRFYDRTGQDASDDAPVATESFEPWVGLFHVGQYELADALAVADKYDHGNGAFTFVKPARLVRAAGEHSNPILCPLYAVIGAMHGHEVSARTRRKSAVW